jgi:elongation factor Ts
MMDCKKALTETGGDIDAAIKLLRTKGLAAASKKAHRSAKEGLIRIAGDRSAAVMLELNCETDFVARNPEFQELADGLTQQAFTEGVDLSELLKRPFHNDPQHTVEEAISQKIATIGENIVLSRIARLEVGPGQQIESYVHGNGKIGVLVAGSDSLAADALHDVAMHIAATDPRFVRRDQVTQTDLDEEREIARRQALDAGKPEHIVDRIVDGKMEKYYSQVVLAEQPFAKDSSVTVGEYVSQRGGADAVVTEFVRFLLGEATGGE